MNEPGVNNNNPDIKSYNEIIEFSNLDIAVCNIVNQHKSFCLPFFEYFNSFVKENFVKNVDKLIVFAERKNAEFNSESKEFRTGFYGMRIMVDYNTVINKLKETKLMLNII